MGTIRKQYSANYQVLELTEEYKEFDDVEIISARMDSIAGKELGNMCTLVKTLIPETPVTAPKQTLTLASEKQVALIKKNKSKCDLIAQELGIKLDANLTLEDAKKIIDGLFKKNNNGF